MLSTDIKKLIENASSNEVSSNCINEMTKFEFLVIWKKDSNGYVLSLSMNDKHFTFVSSKRKDKRVFKTLEAAEKCIKEIGFSVFSVMSIGK